VFSTKQDADRFHRGLAPGTPDPEEIDEDTLGPDGGVIRAGAWVVRYRVFE
jgi:hypothetical protein